MMKKNTKIFLSIIFITISMSPLIFANSYEKVKVKTIDDYYNYLEKVGAVQEQKHIGPDSSQNHSDVLIETNKVSSKEDLTNYSTINHGTAETKENELFEVELISDGNNTKITYTDEYGMKHLLKDWLALSLATGQKGWYHFGNDGNMTLGFYTDKRNRTYYFLEDGVNKGVMATGKVDIDGNTYYFSETLGASYGELVK